MEIFKLFGSVFVDNEKANKSIDDTDKKGKGLSGTLTSMIGTAAKVGAGIVAGVTVAGGAMIGLATKAGNAADRLLDLSDITGMSTGEIQRWEKVTKVAGVSADAMTNASQKLTKSLDTMSNGSGKGAEALTKLGFSYDQIANMNADERMNALTAALAGVEDTTERARIGTDLFGGSWKDIAPIVGMGAEAMAEVKANANIFTEEDLKKANDFRISMDLMRDRVSFLAMDLGIKLIPVAEKFFDWVDKHMPEIEAVFDITFQVIETVVGVAVEVIEAYLIPALQVILEWVKKHLPEIQSFFKKTFDLISNIIKSFIEVVLKFWNVFGDDIIKIISTALNTAKTVFESVLKIIQGILNVFIGLLTGDWGRFAEGLKQIWQGLWTAIEAIVRGAWGMLSTAFSSLKSNIQGWFTGIARDAYNWGRNMISGFVDGIKSMGSAVANAASNTVKAAADYLKFWSPAKKGEGRFITQWGENMIDGFLDGVRNAIPDVEKTFNAVIPNMDMALNPNVVAAGNTSNNNHQYSGDIVIQNMTVRNDSDIKRIARELYNLQKNAGRGVGIV